MDLSVENGIYRPYVRSHFRLSGGPIMVNVGSTVVGGAVLQ